MVRTIERVIKFGYKVWVIVVIAIAYAIFFIYCKLGWVKKDCFTIVDDKE